MNSNKETAGFKDELDSIFNPLKDKPVAQRMLKNLSEQFEYVTEKRYVVLDKSLMLLFRKYNLNVDALEEKMKECRQEVTDFYATRTATVGSDAVAYRIFNEYMESMRQYCYDVRT